jgi:hypothetical protein
MKLAFLLLLLPVLGVAQLATPKIATGIFEHEVVHSRLVDHGHAPLKVYWKVGASGLSLHCNDSTNLLYKFTQAYLANYSFTSNKYYIINHYKKNICLLNDLILPINNTKKYGTSSYAASHFPRLLLLDTLTFVAGVECNVYVGDTIRENPTTHELTELYYEVSVAKRLLHPKPISAVAHVTIPLTAPNMQGIVMHLKISKRSGDNWFTTKCTRYTPQPIDSSEFKLPNYPIVQLQVYKYPGDIFEVPKIR